MTSIQIMKPPDHPQLLPTFTPIKSARSVDEQKYALNDLVLACELRVSERQSTYEEELKRYSGSSESHGGMLGGLLGVWAKREDGTYVSAPWETSLLKALAFDLMIAFDVAVKHGFSVEDIMELGAWNLSNAKANSYYGGGGASEFLIRVGLDDKAKLLRAERVTKSVLQSKQREQDAKRAQTIEHMREIQDGGAIATTSKAATLADALVKRFNRERHLCPTVKNAPAYRNVANYFNEHEIPPLNRTLQGNLHTQESVRKILEQYQGQLTPRKSR
jgi:hypothetical protein